MVMAVRKLKYLEERIFNVLFLWCYIPSVNPLCAPYFDCCKALGIFTGQYCYRTLGVEFENMEVTASQTAPGLS